MKKFAVFDLDGTLIRWQLYHAIADALVKLGFVNGKEYQSVKDARMSWKKRIEHESYTNYERRLVEAYEKVISKLTTQQFEAAADSVFDEYKDQVYTFTRDLITNLKRQGFLLFAISGSQAEIVAKIAGYYGFDDFVGTIYESKGSRFTGKVISHRTGKHLILKKLIAKHTATLKGSVAVGDSEGDISMLETVEKPIAFNPTSGLFKHAKKQGWQIVIERKNVIYKLEPSNGSYLLAETN